MESSLTLLIARIALMLLVWFFVFVVLRTIVKDMRSSSAPAITPVVPPAKHQGGIASRCMIVDGAGVGSYLDFGTRTEVVMGRSSNCDFCVMDDYASQRHARLFYETGQWFVEDLASRNGTWVGGYRIEQPEPVEAGQDITIGTTVVRLES